MSKTLALKIAEELDFEYGVLMSEYLVNGFAEIIHKHLKETERKPLSNERKLEIIQKCKCSDLISGQLTIALCNAIEKEHKIGVDMSKEFLDVSTEGVVSDADLVDAVQLLETFNLRHPPSSTIEEESERSRVMKAKEETKWKIKEVLLGLDNLVFEGLIDERTYKICTLAIERDLEDDKSN